MCAGSAQIDEQGVKTGDAKSRFRGVHWWVSAGFNPLSEGVPLGLKPVSRPLSDGEFGRETATRADGKVQFARDGGTVFYTRKWSQTCPGSVVLPSRVVKNGVPDVPTCLAKLV